MKYIRALSVFRGLRNQNTVKNLTIGEASTRLMKKLNLTQIKNNAYSEKHSFVSIIKYNKGMK